MYLGIYLYCFLITNVYCLLQDYYSSHVGKLQLTSNEAIFLERPVLLGGKICHFQHNLYQRREEALAEPGQGSQVAYSEVQGVIPKIPS